MSRHELALALVVIGSVALTWLAASWHHAKREDRRMAEDQADSAWAEELSDWNRRPDLSVAASLPAPRRDGEHWADATLTDFRGWLSHLADELPDLREELASSTEV